MPTPEELGVQKPKQGRCERCGGPRGRRRSVAHNGLRYVLCAECARAAGASLTLRRRGRHRSGGAPGRLT